MLKILETDLCVIGGGMAGLCAALSAARGGAKVILVHDRPVLGGNVSSEVRMWVRGASTHFPEFREGGIIEELAMDNIFYNPTLTYPIWDGVLYNKVKQEPNLTLLLNTTCIGAGCDGNTITSIKAWQLTTYTEFEIKAKLFADCSGDSILVEFTNAKFRYGREALSEYNEKAGRLRPDKKTMGMSCLIQGRETNKPVKYNPLPFATKYTKEDFIHRLNTTNSKGFIGDNFWWIEKGGDKDTVKEAEEIKDQLISATYGVWDFIKNSGIYDSSNWELDFSGFVAGKRENRRYEGDYVLNQNDLENAQYFEDEVAYGGWSMDDHHPLGMDTNEKPNTTYVLKSPYPIPYRCLYSKNIENLFFAGRNISATHMAMSSTRVMATCALMGQAVGTASAIALKYNITPRKVDEHIAELKQCLRNDDCYLLNTPRLISDTIKESKHNLSAKNLAKLLNGIERNIANEDNCMTFKIGQEISFEFDKAFCNKIRIVFDNDIARNSYDDYNYKTYPTKCVTTLADEDIFIPPALVKKYDIFIKIDGRWILHQRKDNHQRLNYISVNKQIEGIKFCGIETYGQEEIRVFSIDVL